MERRTHSVMKIDDLDRLLEIAAPQGFSFVRLCSHSGRLDLHSYLPIQRLEELFPRSVTCHRLSNPAHLYEPHFLIDAPAIIICSCCFLDIIG